MMVKQDTVPFSSMPGQNRPLFHCLLHWGGRTFYLVAPKRCQVHQDQNPVSDPSSLHPWRTHERHRYASILVELSNWKPLHQHYSNVRRSADNNYCSFPKPTVPQAHFGYWSMAHRSESMQGLNFFHSHTTTSVTTTACNATNVVKERLSEIVRHYLHLYDYHLSFRWQAFCPAFEWGHSDQP